MNNDWHNEDELNIFEGLESYASILRRKHIDNSIVICKPQTENNSSVLKLLKSRSELKDRMLAITYANLESRTLKSFSTITGKGFESLEEQMRIIEGGRRLGKTNIWLANLKAYCLNCQEEMVKKLNVENKYFAEFEYIYRLLKSNSKLPRMNKVKLNYILKCIKGEKK